MRVAYQTQRGSVRWVREGWGRLGGGGEGRTNRIRRGASGLIDLSRWNSSSSAGALPEASVGPFLRFPALQVENLVELSTKQRNKGDNFRHFTRNLEESWVTLRRIQFQYYSRNSVHSKCH